MFLYIYAPTDDKEEDMKQQFYEELQRSQERVQKHDVTITLGDMNAKLWKEKYLAM